jgi:hypothetical protein
MRGRLRFDNREPVGRNQPGKWRLIDDHQVLLLEVTYVNSDAIGFNPPDPRGYCRLIPVTISSFEYYT